MDSALFEKLNALPRNPFHILIRQNRANMKELKRRFLDDGEIPTFTYPAAERFDVKGYMSALDEFRAFVKYHAENDIVRELYLRKIDELRVRADIAAAIVRGDDETVSHLSKNLFGDLDIPAQAFEDEFARLIEYVKELRPKKRYIDAALFEQMVRRVLDHYHLDGWRIRHSTRSTIAIRHGAGSEGIIVIPRRMNITKNRAVALLAHEIEVHALRSNNGLKSPLLLLGRGLDRYLPTEEGLAMHYHKKLRKPEAHDPGFWSTWAVALTKEHDFAGVYRRLFDARLTIAQALGRKGAEKLASASAWRLCLRVYRGITSPTRAGIGFYRDHIYRSGLIAVENAIQKNPDILQDLFVGNCGIEHVPLLRKLDLPAGAMPEMVAKRIVKEVLESNDAVA